MSRWFRVYDDIIDDPKVQLLSPEMFRTWMNTLALASRNSGKLPPIPAMAFALRLTPADAQSRVDDLILHGLIDIMPDGTLEPHNWSKRQWKSDDSAERVKKHRAKMRAVEPATDPAEPCNDGVTVTVTSPVTVTETANVTKCNGAQAVTVTAQQSTDTDTDTDVVVKARARDTIDWKAYEQKLVAAAGDALASQAIAPGLANLSTPLWWLDQGCDLDRDVLPTITEICRRRKRGGPIVSWDFFNAAMANAKQRRELKLTPSEITHAALAGLPNRATPKRTMKQIIAERQAAREAATASAGASP